MPKMVPKTTPSHACRLKAEILDAEIMPPPHDASMNHSFPVSWPSLRLQSRS
jgi:hypothetical protein